MTHTITSIALAVTEKNLSRDLLEEYYMTLTSFYVTLSGEMADLTKKEAIFVEGSQEKTAIGAQNKWAITEFGQKQIEVKYKLRAVEKLISSTKHRIFNAL